MPPIPRPGRRRVLSLNGLFTDPSWESRHPRAMRTAGVALAALVATGCGAMQPADTASSPPTPASFVCAGTASATLAICRLGPNLTPAQQATAEVQGALVGAPQAAIIRYCHGVTAGRPEVVVGSPTDGASAVTACEHEFPNLRTPTPGVDPGRQGGGMDSIWR